MVTCFLNQASPSHYLRRRNLDDSIVLLVVGNLPIIFLLEALDDRRRNLFNKARAALRNDRIAPIFQSERDILICRDVARLDRFARSTDVNAILFPYEPDWAEMWRRIRADGREPDGV